MTKPAPTLAQNKTVLSPISELKYQEPARKSPEISNALVTLKIAVGQKLGKLFARAEARLYTPISVIV
ncbi:MAG: hypothetical protein N4J56_003226 [Chroococcidiopsis sp. SAG 2025]|nr:hypothetical protein [Chroococcidiopsis sp. SAG 2025]